MGVYIGLMIWSILVGSIFLSKKNIKIKKKIYVLLVYIPLILVSGLRSINVGTDTKLFHQWFNASANINIEPGLFVTLADWSSMEIGFAYICYLFNELSIDVQVLIFLVSMITIGGVGYAFYKYSKSIWLSTFLFIALFSYHETLNMARQGIVAMIMLNGYGYLRDNLKLKYLKLICISIFFHFTAILYTSFILLMPIKLKKVIFVLIIFAILMFSEWNIILSFVVNIAPKYLNYIGSQYTISRNLGPGILQIIVIILLMGVTGILYKKYNLYEKREINICNMFMILSIIEIIGQYIIPLIARFNPYFFTYIDLLIPLILSKITITNIIIKYILYFIIILIGFMYCIYNMSVGKHEVTPYSFCF